MSADNDPTASERIRAARIASLELSIDLRLIDLWREIDAGPRAGGVTLDPEIIGPYIRAAYGKGYVDAITEPEPGHLATDHGYRLPSRREAA